MRTILQLHEMVHEEWHDTETAKILHGMLKHIAGPADAEVERRNKSIGALLAEIDTLKAEVRLHKKANDRLRNHNNDLDARLSKAERKLTRIAALPVRLLADEHMYNGVSQGHWRLGLGRFVPEDMAL